MNSIVYDNPVWIPLIIQGIAVSCGVMAIALLDPNENANMENFLKDDEAGSKFKQDMYLNPRFIKSCELIFPFLENKGAFDV